MAVAAYLYYAPPNPMYFQKVQVPYLKDVFLNLGSLVIFLNLVVLVGASMPSI